MRGMLCSCRSLSRRDLRIEQLELRQLLDASSLLNSAIDLSVNDSSDDKVVIVRDRSDSAVPGPVVGLDTERGTLTIVADDQDNDILARVVGAELIVTVDTTEIRVPEDSVEVIEVHAKGGDDSIAIDDSVMKQTTDLDGGTGDDTIVGSRQADVIRGGWGNDRLRGRAGNDRIWGDLAPSTDHATDDLAKNVRSDVPIRARATDHISGGSGNDRLHGGPGADTMAGYSGNDVIYGDGGNDTIYGDAPPRSAADDALDVDTRLDRSPSVNELTDAVRPAGGDDEIFGGSGNDTIHAGAGNDAVRGGSGNDRLLGGAGRDKMDGGEGGDILFGGSGNDALHGGAGNDALLGGAGDDALNGGLGNDFFMGQSGADRIHAVDKEVDFIFRDRYDRISADRIDIIIP